MSDVTQKIRQQGQEQVQRVKDISMQIRNAIRAALPTPPEQFFTVMIPGKVVNFKDFTGGLDASGAASSPLRPLSVQISEAALVDDMPVLGPVQLGPTGRSVARSYFNVLGKLSPATATVGVDSSTDDNLLSTDQVRYRNAMKWLTAADSRKPEQTRVDTYKQKQTAYTLACEKKIKAFNDALDLAVKDPRNGTVTQKRDAYDAWVQENARTYRNAIQAAYIDFVTLGRKEEVEYHFSIVDNDSAMSRVENSKEAMRNSIIITPDGSAEYNRVSLTPSNWAWLAEKKAKTGPVGETVDTLNFKISRLRRLNEVLEQMGKAGADEALPLVQKSTAPRPDTAAADKRIMDADKSVIEKDKALQDIKLKKDVKESEITTAKTSYDNAVTELKDAKANAIKLQQDAHAFDAANKTVEVSDKARELFADGAKGIKAQIVVNETTIKTLEEKLRILGVKVSTSPISYLESIVASKVGIPDEPAEIPLPSKDNDVPPPDYWTKISIEVSSTSESSSNEATADSFSAGASASFGLWSVGGSVNHSSASAKAQSQLANSRCSISFECMRVDIDRPWLRPELFLDDDLSVGDHRVSPGPIRLAAMMEPGAYEIPKSYSLPSTREGMEAELLTYQMFSMFPTSFLLAANVVLEVSGETSELQSSFSTSSTSSGVNVGYGPFTVSASGAHSKTKASASCETTATGCRITIGSPQIIGWINQIIPACPRRQEGMSLSQSVKIPNATPVILGGGGDQAQRAIADKAKNDVVKL